jgi:exopolysaccharide production protein ExoQ
VANDVLRSPSLRAPDLGDRRTRLVLGTTVLGALIAAFVYTIGTGDMRLTLLVAGLAVAPALLVLALKRSYLFPYGLYVVLVPFDNMLKIGNGTGTLTKLLGIASTIFIIIYAIRRKGLNQPPLALYVWLGYLAWTMITIIWSSVPEEGLIDAQQTISLVGMFAVLAVAPVEERDVRAICACIVFGGIASSIYGMYLLHEAPQVVGGTDYGRLMINVDNRTIDANHFANAMLAPIALCLVALLNARRLSVIVGSLAGLGILIAGVVMSLSREAFLGFILLIAVVVAFSKRRVLGALIGIPILVLTPLLVPAIGKRMTDAAATGGAGRTSIWQVGWVAYQQHPWFGWGAGSFIEAYDRMYLRVYQAYNAGWGRASHNTLIHAAVELGLVGLVLIVVAYGASFRMLRGIRRGDPLYDLRVAFTASLVAVAFVGIFIDVANYKYMWVLLSTAAQLRTVVRARRRAAVAAPVSYEPPPPVPLRRRAAPVTS